MSAITKEQLANASAFMNDFWQNLVKPYYNAEDNEVWWTEFFQRISAIGDKYCTNDRRLMKILLGFENGLEEEFKNGRRR